jgi:hypothetical protein
MTIRYAVSVVLFLAAVAASAVAQDKPIDKFATGLYQSPAFKAGLTHSSTQTGSMMGGTRSTNMSVCAAALCPSQNPYNQGNSYGYFAANSHRPAAMVQTAGYGAAPRIDMGYGGGSPMNEDFSGYQKIRVNFKGLTQPLNFNIQLFTGTAYAQGGCNMSAHPGDFSAELPLDKFVQNPGFSFADITTMNVIFQSGSAIGGVSFAITSIELSNTTKSGLVIDCHY